MPRGQRRKSRPQLTLRKVIGRELTRRFRKKSVDPDNVNQAAQISPEQVLGVLTPVASEFIRSAWDDSSFGSSGGSQSNRGLSRRSIQSSAPAIFDSTAATTVFQGQKRNIQCGNDSEHINIIEDDSIGSKKTAFQGREVASSDAASQLLDEQQLLDANRSKECNLGNEQVLQSPPRESQGLQGPMEPDIEEAEETNASPPRILYIQNDSTFPGDASSSKSSTSVSAASKEMQDPQEPMELGGGLEEFKECTEEVPEIIDFHISKGDRSASKSFNPVPLELQIGDMVRVTKKRHVKFGLQGIITKQTACFVYIRESATNSTIQIKRNFVTRIANETPASPCNSTISYTTFFSANTMNDTANNNTTSLEVESRNVMVDDVLKPGDYVRVSKEKHPKFGTHGFIEKITICFAFVKDSNTSNPFRIKPGFLSLYSNDTEETKMTSTLDLKQERQHPLNDITHEVYKMATPNLKNKTEGTEGRVKVKKSHAKHGGKFGTIQRITQHFHFVKFEENPSKEVRIKSRFLTHLDSLNEMDTGNDAQINSRTGAIFDIQSWEVPPIPDEYRLTFGNFPIERVVVSTKQELDVDCVFKLIWNGRWKKVIFELDPKKNNELPIREFTICRAEGWELYYAEADKTKVRGQHFGMYHQPKTVTAYYVQTEGRNMESVDLRQRELMLGDFSTLPSRKVWDRRHLSLSPAKKIHGQYAIFQVASRDIKMVDDVGTTGCGFIEEGYMEELLGGKTAAKRALAIQVRIHVPSKGIFKGMLMRKRGMTGGRIELNESLQKVPPSQILDDGLKDGFITIKQAFPSDSSNQVDRIMTGTKMVTKTFTQGLRNGTECKFPPMVARIWEALNVPVDKIARYLSMSKSPANLRHSWVVGVADPTNELPPNTVFVTGLANIGSNEKHIFVTRSPCMEAKDGRIIRLISSKPRGMSDQNWNWLCSLSFGAVVFGNPEKGHRPLPEIIANGDLDGDIYFVCWDTVILSHIKAEPFSDDELIVENAKAESEEKTANINWFDEAQAHISRIQSSVDLNELTGTLYKKAEKKADENKGDLFIRHPDAVAYATAYKQSLDIKKHGGLITLPQHLHAELHEKFHKYLEPLSS